jgi:MFS family permease
MFGGYVTPRSLAYARAALLLYTSGMCASVVNSGISPSLTQMAAALAPGSRGMFLAQIVLTTTSLAMALLAPVIGVIGERIGHGRMLIGGLVGFLVFGLPGLFLTTPWLMIACRFLLGIAVAATVTPAAVLVYYYFETPLRERVIGLLTGASGLFAVLASAIAGQLVHSFGWQSVHVLYALGLPALLVAGPLLKDGRDSGREVPTAEIREHIEERFPIFTVGATVLAVIGMSVLSFNPVVQMPFVLSSRGLQDPRFVSLIIFALCGSQLLASLFFGWLTLRLSLRLMVTLTLAMYGIGHFLIGWDDGLTWSLCGTAAIGVSAAYVKPGALAYLFTILPKSMHGRAAGFIITSLFLGAFLNPFIMAPLIAAFGVAQSFLLLGVANGAVALIVVVPVLLSSLRHGRLDIRK